MAREAALGNECGQDIPRDPWRVPSGQLLGGNKRLPGPWRWDDKPQAQFQEQTRGKCTCIKHGRGTVERLESIQRFSGIAKLTVIVVLDNDGSLRPCKVRQRDSAREGQMHAERN